MSRFFNRQPVTFQRPFTFDRFDVQPGETGIIHGICMSTGQIVVKDDRQGRFWLCYENEITPRRQNAMPGMQGQTGRGLHP